jgi:phenylacetate-CoA ligase
MPETGEIAEQGRGQLVVTPLFLQAMPLLRYNLGDDVEISYEACDCGWHLPSVQVFGRAAFGYPVGGGRVTQHVLEELVFSLSADFDVLFWRAKAEPDVLRVEIEVPEACRALAVEQLSASIARELRVPYDVLTSDRDVLKPRGLFGADEDWDKALLYF